VFETSPQSKGYFAHRYTLIHTHKLNYKHDGWMKAWMDGEVDG